VYAIGCSELYTQRCSESIKDGKHNFVFKNKLKSA
jgi:hypothetical protein